MCVQLNTSVPLLGQFGSSSLDVMILTCIFSQGMDDLQVRAAATDIFSYLVEFSPSMVREFVMQEPQQTDDVSNMAPMWLSAFIKMGYFMKWSLFTYYFFFFFIVSLGQHLGRNQFGFTSSVLRPVF